MFEDVCGFAEDNPVFAALGIFAVAFKLKMKLWLDRNVYGQHFAISIALSKNTGTATIDKISGFQSKYIAACLSTEPAHLFGQGNVAKCLQYTWETYFWHKNGSQLGRKKQKNGSGAYASASMEPFLLRRENNN